MTYPYLVRPTMPVIHHTQWSTSAEHMALILVGLRSEDRVISVVRRGRGPAAVAAIRVSLSRSRNRNRRKNLAIKVFTLHHELSPLTTDGERLDAIAFWISQSPDQKFQELLQGNSAHVA